MFPSISHVFTDEVTCEHTRKVVFLEGFLDVGALAVMSLPDEPPLPAHALYRARRQRGNVRLQVKIPEKI